MLRPAIGDTVKRGEDSCEWLVCEGSGYGGLRWVTDQGVRVGLESGIRHEVVDV